MGGQAGFHAPKLTRRGDIPRGADRVGCSFSFGRSPGFPLFTVFYFIFFQKTKILFTLCSFFCPNKNLIFAMKNMR
jgi:hypothetical protein